MLRFSCWYRDRVQAVCNTLCAGFVNGRGVPDTSGTTMVRPMLPSTYDVSRNLPVFLTKFLIIFARWPFMRYVLIVTVKKFTMFCVVNSASCEVSLTNVHTFRFPFCTYNSAIKNPVTDTIFFQMLRQTYRVSSSSLNLNCNKQEKIVYLRASDSFNPVYDYLAWYVNTKWITQLSKDIIA